VNCVEQRVDRGPGRDRGECPGWLGPADERHGDWLG
jgi:hypothetical protein